MQKKRKIWIVAFSLLSVWNFILTFVAYAVLQEARDASFERLSSSEEGSYVMAIAMRLFLGALFAVLAFVQYCKYVKSDDGEERKAQNEQETKKGEEQVLHRDETKSFENNAKLGTCDFCGRENVPVEGVAFKNDYGKFYRMACEECINKRSEK